MDGSDGKVTLFLSVFEVGTGVFGKYLPLFVMGIGKESSLVHHSEFLESRSEAWRQLLSHDSNQSSKCRFSLVIDDFASTSWNTGIRGCNYNACCPFCWDTL